jgi:uncharacterized protein YkwD
VNKFKKYFIPHKGNNNRPHFFHFKNVLLVVLFVFGIELFSFVRVEPIIKMGGQNTGAVLLSVLGGLTNNERQAMNIPELKINPLLSEAAQLKANDMAAKGYFGHTSPEGKTPWHWLNKVGYKYDYAGENLAINFTDTKDITDAWMKSPTHRANIVKAAYTEMGSGMAVGMYRGMETIFVVQEYGNPRAGSGASVAVNTPKVSPTVRTDGIPSQSAVGTSSKIAQTGILGAETEDAATTTNVASPVALNTFPDAEQIAKPQNVTKANFVESLLFSPRHFADRILFGILVFVFLALILKMALNFRVQHWDLVRNGLLIIAVIISLQLINSYRTNKNAPTVSNVDYSAATTTEAE